jgi:hypothetical protein
MRTAKVPNAKTPTGKVHAEPQPNLNNSNLQNEPEQ